MVKKSLPLYLSLPLLGIAVFVAAVAFSNSAKAQPVLGAGNTALGGGGTAYLMGPEATLWNPANLAISDRHGNFHLGLGHAGLLYEPVLSTELADNQYFAFTDVYYPYKPHSADISLEQRNTILDHNYPENTLVSQHQTRTDIILGGAQWQRRNEAFSIIARARFASRIEAGRGWYSNAFIETAEGAVRDFTLTQQRNHLYELSFGYGRKFTFINGLLPTLNKLYVGIAPKLVLAGPHLNMRYSGRYLRHSKGNNEIFTERFSYKSTGNYTAATLAYRSGVPARQAIQNNFSRRLSLDNTGYGMGFDFGLTYLIPLGDDFSTIAADPAKAITSKSIRIAFSVNDVGLVQYEHNPLRMSIERDSSVAITQQDPPGTMFIGADGQYLSYFDKASELPNPLLNSSNPKQGGYTALLPTSMNAGLLLQYSRLKLMGDLTLGLHNTAFTTTKLALHLGLEARPIKPIPLRFGMRFASGLPTQLGLGTGIETNHWDFNIGTQILIRSRTFTSEIVGGAFAGIQLHL